MAKHPDLIGQVFGRLTAVCYAGNNKWGQALWEVRCVCSLVTVVTAQRLLSGNTRSCGCLSKELTAQRARTHGMRNHRAYGVWRHMRDRCGNATHKAWRYYGGSGIKVCHEWQASFAAFWADMGATYAPGLTIERINNNGNYAPGNCRWATTAEQNQNKRTTIHVNGMSLGKYADSVGIPRTTAQRLHAKGLLVGTADGR